MATTTRNEPVLPGWRRRQALRWGTTASLVWAVVGMLGGGLMMVSAFLPWLERSGLGRRRPTVTYTGWDLYQRRSDAGENVFAIHHPFARTAAFPSWLDWFATGLLVFLIGLVVVLGAGLVLACNWRMAPPTRLVVRIAIVAPATLGVIAALFVTWLDMFSSAQIAYFDNAYGLGVALIGGIVASCGVVAAVTPVRAKPRE